MNDLLLCKLIVFVLIVLAFIISYRNVIRNKDAEYVTQNTTRFYILTRRHIQIGLPARQRPRSIRLGLAVRDRGMLKFYPAHRTRWFY